MTSSMHVVMKVLTTLLTLTILTYCSSLLYTYDLPCYHHIIKSFFHSQQLHKISQKFALREVTILHL